MPPLPFLLLALHSRTRTILLGSRLPPAMKRKRPIRRAHASRRGGPVHRPARGVGGDASPFSSFHERAKTGTCADVCELWGGREGPPRSALRHSPELASPLRAKARSPDP